MQTAINDINYGVAQLIDMRIDIARKTSDALESMNQNNNKSPESRKTPNQR